MLTKAMTTDAAAALDTMGNTVRMVTDLYSLGIVLGLSVFVMLKPVSVAQW